jgi:hypothetical protein
MGPAVERVRHDKLGCQLEKTLRIMLREADHLNPIRDGLSHQGMPRAPVAPATKTRTYRSSEAGP